MRVNVSYYLKKKKSAARIHTGLKLIKKNIKGRTLATLIIKRGRLAWECSCGLYFFESFWLVYSSVLTSGKLPVVLKFFMFKQSKIK